MQYIYLIFLGIISINKIKCHVTDRAKNAGISETLTTQLPAENDTRNVLYKDTSAKKYESAKNVQGVESSVYLDDVLFAMKNQNWTAAEEPCLDHIYRLLYSLQNFTLWAVWGKWIFFRVAHLAAVQENYGTRLLNFRWPFICLTVIGRHLNFHRVRTHLLQL